MEAPPDPLSNFLSNPIFAFFTQLDLSPEAATAAAAEQRDHLADTFKRFRRVRRERQHALGAHIEVVLEGMRGRSQLDRSRTRFNDYYEFLLQLPTSDVTTRSVKRLFSKARKLIRHAIRSQHLTGMRTLCVELSHQLLAAVYKARASVPTQLVPLLQHFQARVEKYLGLNLSSVPPQEASRILFLLLTLAGLAFAFGAFAEGVSSHLITQLLLFRRRFSTSEWTDLDDDVRFRHAVFSLYALIHVFGPTGPIEPKLGYSHATILDFRQCMIDGVSVLRRGGASVFTSFFESQLDRINEGLTRNVKPLQLTVECFTAEEQRRLTTLAARFSSYRHPVGLERVLQFLSQFGCLHEMRLALKVLEQIKYYSLKHLQAMLEHAVQSVPSDLGTPQLVVPLGSIEGSTSLMNYLAGHWRLGRIVVEPDLEKALRMSDPNTPLWLFDDCCLSGTQSLAIFGDLLGTRVRQPHHIKYADPLSQPDLLRKRPIRLVYAIISSESLTLPQKLQDDLGCRDVHLFYSSVENLDDKIFTPSMIHLWDDPQDMVDIRTAFARIGSQILARRAQAKSWPLDRAEKSALGFQDYQRLVVFQYNVPKSTLTALWEKGDYQGKPWLPLFPTND